MKEIKLFFFLHETLLTFNCFGLTKDVDAFHVFTFLKVFYDGESVKPVIRFCNVELKLENGLNQLLCAKIIKSSSTNEHQEWFGIGVICRLQSLQ